MLKYSSCRVAKVVVSFAILSLPATLAVAQKAKVYTSYLWHMQQPNYWPERSGAGKRYLRASEQLNGSPTYPAHPRNDLREIFGKDDRVAIYQWRTKDSVASMANGGNDAGAQISYSGVLSENIISLGAANQLGYSGNWNQPMREAFTWKTTTGRPKLEPVGFSYHHAIMPLIDPRSVEMEVALDQYLWSKIWNADPAMGTKGFRMSEESFSVRNIKQLVEAGYEWVIVPNHHLARAQSNYKRLHNNGQYDDPNPADMINPPSQVWNSGEIDGRGATLSSPFSYQVHWAKYVDPDTGKEYKIMVVPMADLMSYQDGYGQHGTEGIDREIAPYASSEQPSIVLYSHDGDNAWGGGYSYYMEAVPQFVAAAKNKGYVPTTIQTMLDRAKPPANDVVHVEDGSWINAENDWGHPQYINWLWYPQRNRKDPSYNRENPASYADIEGGWSEDFRNWAVVTAGQNYVETAEQIHRQNGGEFRISKVQDPNHDGGFANPAELAWHYFLPAIASCYMYYGSSLDMEVKASLAVNQAITEASKLVSLAGGGLDRTAPSVFVPQRYPYNPGAVNYGPQYGYRRWHAPSDFYIWTFVHDLSDVADVRLMVRADHDGKNPLSSNDNETYSGGSEVGKWQSFSMKRRSGSTFRDNIFNDPEVDFFIQPKAIADQYWYKLSGYSSQLIDYYVEAVDRLGNVKRTDIQHVYVGAGPEVPKPGQSRAH